MLIEIRLLARLLRIPLLRVEGVVAIRDDEDVGGASASLGTTRLWSSADGAGHAPPYRAGYLPDSAYGTDLASAEAIIAGLSPPDGARKRRAR
jgi:hypothetical protein